MSNLVSGRFVARPHRFAVRARLDDGREVEAHMGDPGRLRELLLPEAELRLRPAPPGSRRKTDYSAALVRSAEPPFPWVSLEPARANNLADGLLRDGSIDGLGRLAELRREVRHGESRFDFRVVDAAGDTVWIEVKQASLVEQGVALFPDAPTQRGRRHVEELTALAAAGERAMVLFIVPRHDASLVRPHAGIDPEFAEALTAAGAAGVALRAAAFRLNADGGAEWLGSLPIET
ncbi:hypothetical protein ABI59_20235 [Acidobacteria bacterium Mor1]|nr:hypothetical protein ABI59_20235 [Acidobacteria bacterium Mor1]